MAGESLGVLARNWANLLDAASERAAADPEGVGRVAFRANKRWKAPADLLASAGGRVPIYFRTGTSFGQFVTHAAELERVLIDDELAVEGQRIARELALESTAEETWDEKTLYIIRRCHPVQPVPVSSLLKKDGQPAAGGQAVYAIVQATELQPLGTWFPEEAPPELAKMEGAVQKVLVNRYERDPAARQMCIEANGVRCAVCDMSFEERYGERGKGYIHVHHRTPLADLDGPKAFDPKVDLVPICPNCHAMIHRGSTTLSIEELKDLLTS